ncbi:MAG: 16S rRNA (guanine(527)-N(7))-methyltransferase RsmG [Shimia sp.]
MNVSRETLQDLREYEHLLRTWNDRISLVSEKASKEIISRHIPDSLDLRKHLPSSARTITDVGSGGGFPAIPCAIVDKHCNSARRWTLVESDTRKAAFLVTVVRELSLSCDILPKRVEAVHRLPPDCITARAFAALHKLLTLTLHLAGPETRWFLPKGARFMQEIEDAQKHFSFTWTAHRATASAEGCVLEIWDCREVEPRGAKK